MNNERSKKGTFWIFPTLRTLMQGAQNDITQSEELPQHGNCSMPTLMEDRKAVVWLEYEFKYRENLKIKRFLRTFQTIRSLMPGTKNKDFSGEYLSSKAVFLIETLMEEIEFW